MLSTSALSFATTIFGYFSPTKSPYYAIIVFGVVSLLYLVHAGDFNWLSAFVPIIVTLVTATTLSLRSKPNFTATEYNDQLKFARSFGISSALLCLSYIVTHIEPHEADNGQLSNSLEYLISYYASLVHIALFLSYIFVFHNFNARRKGVNFVQLSLVISTYLIGITFITVHFRSGNDHDFTTLIFLLIMWLTCAVYLCLYLFRNIRFQIPEDAELVNIEDPGASEASGTEAPPAVEQLEPSSSGD